MNLADFMKFMKREEAGSGAGASEGEVDGREGIEDREGRGGKVGMSGRGGSDSKGERKERNGVKGMSEGEAWKGRKERKQEKVWKGKDQQVEGLIGGDTRGDVLNGGYLKGGEAKGEPGGQVEEAGEGERDTVFMKPPGMPQEDYDAALAIFSPQRINELYQNFDPNGIEPFYEQLFRQVKREIKEPDEQRISAARNVAGIGDALSLIAQSVAASHGSLIDKRDDSASLQTDARIEKLKEAYKRDRDAFDAGLLGAMGKDVEGARGGYMKDRAALLAYLAGLKKAKAANDWQNRKFEGEMRYKYDKLKSDAAAKRDKLRSDEAGRKAKLDLDRQKAKARAGGSGSLKYMDFYNPVSGTSYRVEQNKWKANYTQIYNRIKKELYKSYPMLERLENFGELKPEQKEEYVKQYMYKNPAALKFLDDIADMKYKDGEAEPEVVLPELTGEQYRAIEEIARANRRDERDAKRKIVEFLKGQGFSREQVVVLMQEMEAE